MTLTFDFNDLNFFFKYITFGFHLISSTMLCLHFFCFCFFIVFPSSCLDLGRSSRSVLLLSFFLLSLLFTSSVLSSMRSLPICFPLSFFRFCLLLQELLLIDFHVKFLALGFSFQNLSAFVSSSLCLSVHCFSVFLVVSLSYHLLHNSQ